MSIHALVGDTEMGQLRALLVKYLRPPSGIVYGNGPSAPATALEFVPDLDVGDQALLTRILSISARPVQWAPTDEDIFQTEKPVLVAYLANATPTLVQTATALKSLMRVVRAIVKD